MLQCSYAGVHAARPTAFYSMVANTAHVYRAPVGAEHLAPSRSVRPRSASATDDVVVRRRLFFFFLSRSVSFDVDRISFNSVGGGARLAGKRHDAERFGSPAWSPKSINISSASPCCQKRRCVVYCVVLRISIWALIWCYHYYNYYYHHHHHDYLFLFFL